MMRRQSKYVGDGVRRTNVILVPDEVDHVVKLHLGAHPGEIWPFWTVSHHYDRN